MTDYRQEIEKIVDSVWFHGNEGVGLTKKMAKEELQSLINEVRKDAVEGLWNTLRIPYGLEKQDWGANKQPCHDCGVKKGEIHKESCDVERCPFCGGQLITCNCDVSEKFFEYLSQPNPSQLNGGGKDKE